MTIIFKPFFSQFSFYVETYVYEIHLIASSMPYASLYLLAFCFPNTAPKDDVKGPRFCLEVRFRVEISIYRK